MDRSLLLGIDSYRNQLKSGSGTLRIKNPTRQPFEQGDILKPKSTSRKNDFSPYVSLKHRFQDLSGEFDSRLDDSMKRQYSTIKDNKNSEVKREDSNSKKQQSPLKQPILQQTPIKNNRQEMRRMLLEMSVIINSQQQSLDMRMNQFKQSAKQHIENQYKKFKEAMKSFIDEIFKAAHVTFINSFQKKLIELNSGYSFVEEQLANLSTNIKGLISGVDHPQWARKIAEIDPIKIKSQVEQISMESENLNFESATINFDKKQLAVIEKAFKLLLNIKT